MEDVTTERSAPTPLRSRLAGAARRVRRAIARLAMDDPSEVRASRLDTGVATLIAIVSIASAVTAWRVSISSGTAGGFDARALQQTARREQIQRYAQGIVGQDRRMLDRYQEHVSAARALKENATRVRAFDPTYADELDVRAQGELTLANVIAPYVAWAGYRGEEADGTIRYDPEYGLRQLTDADTEYQELRPEENTARAVHAHEKTRLLFGVGLLDVTSLFFLTLAQALTRDIRRAFAVVGALGAAVGVSALVLIEAGWR
jgi:hypothetical protein